MTQRMDIQEFNECSGEHMHTYPQILVPMRAPLKIHIGNARYEVTQQELCLVPAGMTHCCDYVGKLLAINLSEDMLDNRDMALLSSPMIVSMRGQIVQLVELIQAEIRQNADSKAVRYLYSYLYSKLLENCAALRSSHHGQPAGGDGELQRHLLQ